MPIPIQFWKMTKEVNSTKRPIAAATVTHQCSIKAPCSILTPDIELYMPLDTNNPSPLNYCFIEAFDRYYWVRDWEWSGSYWTAHCEVDVLASWKNSIGASQQYVLRSASSWDGDIVDNLYPMEGVITEQSVQAESPWDLDFNHGSIVVGVTGSGGNNYYIFDPESQFPLFMFGNNGLLSDYYASKLVDGWDSVFPQLKAQINPLQYISSIRWYPGMLPTLQTELVTGIRVGWGEVLASGSRILGDGVATGSISFTPPRHPQAASRGRYMNLSPFSDYQLFIPPWGVMSLDPGMVAEATSIRVDYLIDTKTGNAIANIVYAGDTDVVYSRASARIGTDLQVSHIVAPGWGVGNIANGVLSMATSLPGMAADQHTDRIVPAANYVSSIFNTMGVIAASKVPSQTSLGQDGGISNLYGTPALNAQFRNAVPEDIEHRGRPLCQRRTISTLSGYMTIADPDIDFSCTSEEGVAIRSFMTGGFYYE